MALDFRSFVLSTSNKLLATIATATIGAVVTVVVTSWLGGAPSSPGDMTTDKAAPTHPQQGENENPKPEVKQDLAPPAVPTHPPAVVAKPSTPPPPTPSASPEASTDNPGLNTQPSPLPQTARDLPAPVTAEPQSAPPAPAPPARTETPDFRPAAPKRAKEAVAADILSAGYGEDLWQEFCALPASERRSLSETADPVQMLAFYRARRALLETRVFRCTIVSNAGQQKPVTKQLSDEEICWQLRCPNELAR